MDMYGARSGRLGILAGSLVALLAFPTGSWADDPALVLHAFALNFVGGGAGRSEDIDIIVDRWSTDEERDRLRDLLAAKGGAALLPELLQIEPAVGSIRPKRDPSWKVRFAQSHTLADGSRIIILATDRPLTPAERSRQHRTDEHEFLLVEIRLDKHGKGEGKAADGTAVSVNKGTGSLEVDQYAVDPVWLVNVEVLPSKPER